MELEHRLIDHEEGKEDEDPYFVDSHARGGALSSTCNILPLFSS